MTSQSQFISVILTLMLLVLVVRRTLKTQVVRTWSLISMPALVILAAVWFIRATPPSTNVGIAAIVVGACAGAALGYARGIHSKVELGPRPGTLIVQGNILLVAILVAAFALRFIVRTFAGVHGPIGNAISEAFIVFAAASVAVARGMLYFAWRRLAFPRFPVA